MTDICEPTVQDAGAEKEQDADKVYGADEEPGPGQETADQRRQRRLARELALRALI